MMELVDCFRSSALVLAFLSTAFAGKSTWILADALGSLGFGVSFLICPSMIFGYVVDDKLDLVHVMLARILGVQLIMTSLVSLYARKSKDGSVQTAVCVGRMMSGLLLLVLMGMEYYGTGKHPKFNEKHTYFAMMGCGLWMFGHFIQICSSDNNFSSRKVGTPDGLNYHVLISLIWTVMSCFYKCGFPNHTIEMISMSNFSPDPLHLHTIRMMSAMELGICLFLISSLSFTNDEDRRGIFISEIVGITLCVMTATGYQYIYSLIPWGVLLGNLGIAALLLLNSVMAAMTSSDDSMKLKRY